MTGPTSGRRGGGALAAAQAVTAAMLGPFPAFLTGALAVFITEDIPMGPGDVGIAVAVLYVASAVTSPTAGARVQAIGARWSLTTAGSCAGIALLGMALAGRWWHLALWLVVAGVGNAMAQPAANLLISGAIDDRRLGTAFGVKQSAIPAATLLAGLAVPVIGAGLGWRWAYAGFAVLAFAFAAAAATSRARRAPTRVRGGPAGRTTRLPVLVVLTVGGGLGAAATTTLGAFLVGTGIASGVSTSLSGIMVSVASVLGMVSRVLIGAAIDHPHPRAPKDAFRVVTVLMVVGSLAYAVLAAEVPLLYVLGAIGGYTIAWGWMGVFHFGVVRENRASAASATGIIMTGTTLGAGLGPLGFGQLVEAFGYPAGWLATALVSCVAGLLVWLGRRLLEASRPESAPVA